MPRSKPRRRKLMADNTREELYKDDKGQWFLYIPGPMLPTGEHYDQTNVALPPQFGKALNRYVAKAQEQLISQLDKYRKETSNIFDEIVLIDTFIEAKRKEIEDRHE